MAQTQNITNQKKSENAFLNEIRGRLLEFSCALNLAQSTGQQAIFFRELGEVTIAEIQQYENYLRINDHKSYQYIQQAGFIFSNYYRENNKQQFEKILLTGKLVDKSNFKEADIVVVSDSCHDLVSIKLIKSNSFINSKSAGIKSIFSKYFNNSALQDELNKNIDLYFNQFKLSFFEHFDRCEQEITFSELLKEYNLSDRPGQLPKDLRNLLFQFYRKCIEEVHHVFSWQFQHQLKQFHESLKPLLGFGQATMKVYTFVHDANFSTPRMTVHDAAVTDTQKIDISDVTGNTSFFVKLDQLILQIRVKPMNSFLAPSMKVNCSVKFKDDD